MTQVVQQFAWEGVDAQGVAVSGQAAGRSSTWVRARLQARGIEVAWVRSASARQWRWPQRGKADAAGFSRQLATLLNAGIPLLQSFEVMGRAGADARMAALLQRLREQVAGGLALADALRQHPAWFDALYCNLVRVGEQAGTLERQLEQLATMLEQRQAMLRKVRKAMMYPLILLLTGLGVAALLLLEVVPRFQGLFASFDKALPPFTQAVIDVSTLLGEHAIGLLLVLSVGACAGRLLYRRYAPARQWLLQRSFALPVLGGLRRDAALARFSRSLATSYGAGVALLDALDSVAAASGDELHEQAIRRLRSGMANGLGLSQAMSGSTLFPPMLVQMVAIGESSGTLDLMLDKAAQHYEARVSQVLDQLGTLLEPAVVLILGVLVGGLVVAMYLPIFQMGSLF
ncbi:type II secretion system F family protein [Pseudomonas cremoricolorata]|uniref:Type II secretion system protein F n=1 Tax=Pseudomonas cremoricolorata TaxID=157783 RepID=A0A089WFW4_9PSED|nr:type II secretion system F family protein [Pseudomonas cremoricolorata]AIR88135.1 type II secretion system protein F [Pseudomonas cremoricolorata]